MSKEVIGFIGLGIMGKPMARNLLNAGYSVIVHNRSRGSVDELSKEGAKTATSSKEVAERSEIVITMLPDSPDVESVYAGEQGIFSGVKSGQLLIDMSSISPVVARKLAAEAAKRGCDMLDAPVSGGEAGAISATLSIMIGGKTSAVERAMPIFQPIRWSSARPSQSSAKRSCSPPKPESTRRKSGKRCSAALLNRKFSKRTGRRCWTGISNPASVFASMKKT